MRSTKKPIQTGLEIDVKPISDRGMTEEEYRAKVAEIQKQHETPEALNKVAEQHLAQRKPRGPVQRRPTPRRVVRVFNLFVEYWLLNPEHHPLWDCWLFLIQERESNDQTESNRRKMP